MKIILNQSVCMNILLGFQREKKHVNKEFRLIAYDTFFGLHISLLWGVNKGNVDERKHFVYQDQLF
jgi:hypothetical protein